MKSKNSHNRLIYLTLLICGDLSCLDLFKPYSYPPNTVQKQSHWWHGRDVYKIHRLLKHLHGSSYAWPLLVLQYAGFGPGHTVFPDHEREPIDFLKVLLFEGLG